MGWVLKKNVDQIRCGESVFIFKITNLVFADDSVLLTEAMEVLEMTRSPAEKDKSMRTEDFLDHHKRSVYWRVAG